VDRQIFLYVFNIKIVMPDNQTDEKVINWGEILLAILLFFFGCLLIANGACTIEWTRMGGIEVNGTTEVTTTTGAKVEVPTEEEKELIGKGRRDFLQAMSAINIIAGLFLFALALYFGLPNSLTKGITSSVANRTKFRRVVERNGITYVQDGSGEEFAFTPAPK
jgi:sulfite exporter TauE/SafE